jgi:glucose uptake protein GlcU
MVDSIFEGCSDSCGWLAGIVAALAYGSFGVPIRETKDIDVHPLVFQSYKTITMFMLSWLVIFMGIAPSWTSWGLVSGGLWVVGGTGGVLAIRMAGLAIAVGTWASVMIVINFLVGIVLFQEPVSDMFATLGAFLLLALGLVGMSLYSTPQPVDQLPSTEMTENIGPNQNEVEEIDRALIVKRTSSYTGKIDHRDIQRRNEESGSYGSSADADEPLFTIPREPKEKDPDQVLLCGVFMKKRVAGICGAIFNGVMTGSSLIPLHHAKTQGYGGANYMISYASGAIVMNCLIWGVFFAYTCYQTVQQDLNVPVLLHTFQVMPAWHFRKLWLPGFTSGVLLTIAMFGSILSVTYLGQGIGNSIVQAKILISGLWGIFWFREIRGMCIVTKWFLSASLTVAGILWLSAERMAATKGQSGGH